MRNLFLLFFLAFGQMLHAQNVSISDYSGNWDGVIMNPEDVAIKLELKPLSGKSFQFSISNGSDVVQYEVESSASDHIHLPISERAHFTGRMSPDGQTLRGFFRSGILMHQVVFECNSKGVFQGSWYPLFVDSLQDKRVFLSVELEEDGQFATYPFFGDQRFTGTWCNGFQLDKNIVQFSDFKTGLQFEAQLLGEQIDLSIRFDDLVLMSSSLERSSQDWVFNAFAGQSQNLVQDYNFDETILDRLRDSISAEKIVNTHSILMHQNGDLILEEYFEGYTAETPHDQRSASKSVASAMIGIAIDQGLIKDEFETLDFGLSQTLEAEKATITLQDLLTMRSGLDAIDFGIDRQSKASEGAYQSSPDWLKTVLSAPMIEEPGTKAYYGSANPYLLGIFLDQLLEYPVELFMDQHLLKPLGIDRCIIQTDETGLRPYFGGGMYLSPKDMIKFGLAYLPENLSRQSGAKNRPEVISRKWKKASFKKYGPLLNTRDENEYGYLWWHKSYKVRGRVIESIEARGSGGQYIFVVPELDLVAVITSGNFRNGKTSQPEMIFEEYLLPAWE